MRRRRSAKLWSKQAEVEGIEPFPLHPCGLAQLGEARGDLLRARRRRYALGERACFAGGKPLERDRVGHLRARVLGVEVDDGVEAVAVAVDVGGIGVNVLAQRVVLD